jgi:excisionase family DNA binding protein
MPDPFLTVADVASTLKISEDSVLGHIQTKRLRAVNVGSGVRRPRWRIRREDLDQFLELRVADPVAPRQRQRKKTTEKVTRYF